MPDAVQRVLAPIVWERTGSHKFWISSEKYGTITRYGDGVSADPTREWVEIDIGREYIDLGDHRMVAQTHKFAREMLRNRLLLAHWRGTPEQLVGSSKPYRSIMQDIKNNKRNVYYGLETIAELCSGDLATLLQMFRRVLENCDEATTTMVSPARQHKAIVDTSRELLDVLTAHRPYGLEMYTVAIEYGTFVKRSIAHQIAIGHNTRAPIEIPRIEVDGGAMVRDALTEDEQGLYRELVRRAVFIEMRSGLNSRPDNMFSLRWHFRRVYLPAFNAGLRKNDSLRLTPDQFVDFLKRPKQLLESRFAARERTLGNRRSRRRRGGRDDNLSIPLFERNDNETGRGVQ